MTYNHIFVKLKMQCEYKSGWYGGFFVFFIWSSGSKIVIFLKNPLAKLNPNTFLL